MQPRATAGDVAAGQQLIEQADECPAPLSAAGKSAQAIAVRPHLVRFQLMKACEVLQHGGLQGLPAAGTEQQRALAGVDQAHVSGQHPTAARSVELPLQSLRIEPGVAVGQQCR
ncbi:hypothetical protein D3C81_853260 [compost metagenome]